MQHPMIEYPKHQWWIAATSNEVSRDLLARTLLEKRVVMYRQENGDPVAVEGYCPHRNYPLEKGTLSGDAIRCGYHGFEFDQQGICSHIPSQSQCPNRAVLRSFPIIERGGLIWIWMGPPETATVDALPDTYSMGLGAPGWQVEVSPVAALKGRYSLLIDNLMDLTHVSFIHADTIPAGEQVVKIPNEIMAENGRINVIRKGIGIPSNPFFKFMFPDYDGPVDQHFDTDYIGPCIIRTGGALSQSDTKEHLGAINFIHGITPETRHSTHYFVLIARDFALDRPEVGQAHLKMGDMIQPQDIDAIEAIELGLRQFPDMPPEISCQADLGGLKVRRQLEAQILAEQ